MKKLPLFSVVGVVVISAAVAGGIGYSNYINRFEANEAVAFNDDDPVAEKPRLSIEKYKASIKFLGSCSTTFSAFATHLMFNSSSYDKNREQQLKDEASQAFSKMEEADEAGDADAAKELRQHYDQLNEQITQLREASKAKDQEQAKADAQEAQAYMLACQGTVKVLKLEYPNLSDVDPETICANQAGEGIAALVAIMEPNVEARKECVSVKARASRDSLLATYRENGIIW